MVDGAEDGGEDTHCNGQEVGRHEAGGEIGE
jgi:hypothetical protein